MISQLDTQAATEEFRTVYDDTIVKDGYVLEVNPYLAHDKKGTIEEAKWILSSLPKLDINTDE